MAMKDESQRDLARRRSTRYPLFAPILVQWSAPDQSAHTAEAHARDVSIHGGLLQFLNSPDYPRAGTEILLRNLLTGEETRARAGDVRRTREGSLLGMVAELLQPSETFWGLTFWVKKTAIELRRLDLEIMNGSVDPRVLQEFRDAVDYVRKTAWAVQEWQERQRMKKDTATVLPLLFTERVRRAGQLCEAVQDGLKEHEITGETEGLRTLYEATGKLSGELRKILEGGKSPS